LNVRCRPWFCLTSCHPGESATKGMDGEVPSSRDTRGSTRAKLQPPIPTTIFPVIRHQGEDAWRGLIGGEKGVLHGPIRGCTCSTSWIMFESVNLRKRHRRSPRMCGSSFPVRFNSTSPKVVEILQEFTVERFGENCPPRNLERSTH